MAPVRSGSVAKWAPADASVAGGALVRRRQHDVVVIWYCCSFEHCEHGLPEADEVAEVILALDRVRPLGCHDLDGPGLAVDRT